MEKSHETRAAMVSRLIKLGDKPCEKATGGQTCKDKRKRKWNPISGSEMCWPCYAGDKSTGVLT